MVRCHGVPLSRRSGQTVVLGTAYEAIAPDASTGGGQFQIWGDVSDFPTGDGYVSCVIVVDTPVSERPMVFLVDFNAPQHFNLKGESALYRVGTGMCCIVRSYLLRATALVGTSSVETSQLIRIDNSGGA